MKKKILSLVALVAMTLSFGQSWTQQNSGIPLADGGVRDFSIVDANTAWITFYDGSGNQTYPKYVANTTNGGTTWTAKLVSSLPSSALISDIHAFDNNNAYIVSAPASGTTANGLWKTSDAGSSWTKVSGIFNNSSFGNIIYFWNNSEGIVIGDPVGSKYEMYKTTDGGTTWNTLSTAPSPVNGDEYGYVGGKVSYGDHLWLTSNTGRILHTADKGLTWNSYIAPIDDFAGENSSGAMSFSSENYGLIVDNTGWLWVTEDGGSNWELKDAQGYYTADIKYIPGSANTFVSTGLNVYESEYGSAYSNDGGKTWVNIDFGVTLADARINTSALDCNTIYTSNFATSTGQGGILKLNGTIPGCTLAVNDQTLTKVELKAVVNNGILNIVTNKDVKDILVGDMSAKTLASSTTKFVNVSQLKSGVYFARVAYVDGSNSTIKFVIK